MSKALPSRPNLDHLRSQAKRLLARLREGDPAAAQTLIDHLPSAAKLTPAKARAAGFRLADAQSAIARQSGFAAWPALARHVAELRALEGEWRFASLEVDGADVPPAMTATSKILIDGDRFRTESPEATFEGVFTIDVEANPATIDIEFVEGPEAGNWCRGIYELAGDEVRFCLGLVGATRPERFATAPGSGHALERLTRASATRPDNVTGGTRAAPEPETETVGDEGFELVMTPLLERLQGTWTPVELVSNGKALAAPMLAYGSRTMTGNETKVVFGGQVMVHAKVRIDETATPIAIDYRALGAKPTITRGILAVDGDVVTFCMAAPGAPRPTELSCTPGSKRTRSAWRKA